MTCHGFIPDNQRLVVRLLIKNLEHAMPLFYHRANGIEKLLALCTPQNLAAVTNSLFYDGSFRLSLCSQYAMDDKSSLLPLDPLDTTDGGPNFPGSANPIPAAAAAARHIAPGSSLREGGPDVPPGGGGGGGGGGGVPLRTSKAAVFLREDAVSAGLRSTDLKPNTLLYHVRLMQLLTACCYGQNFEVEAKCQDLISLAAIVGALRRLDLPLALRLVLHEFFLEAWLYTERLPLAVANHQPLILMFEEVAPTLDGMLRGTGVDSSAEEAAHPSWCDRTRWRVSHAFGLQYVFGAFLPSLLLFLGVYREDSKELAEAMETGTGTDSVGNRDHLSVAKMLNTVVGTFVRVLTRMIPGMSRTVGSFLTHTELTALSNLLVVVGDLPLLRDTIHLTMDLHHALQGCGLHLRPFRSSRAGWSQHHTRVSSASLPPSPVAFSPADGSSNDTTLTASNVSPAMIRHPCVPHCGLRYPCVCRCVLDWMRGVSEFGVGRRGGRTTSMETQGSRVSCVVLGLALGVLLQVPRHPGGPLCCQCARCGCQP